MYMQHYMKSTVKSVRFGFLLSQIIGEAFKNNVLKFDVVLDLYYFE